MRVRMGNNSYAAAGTSVMLNDFTGADKVYTACGYTDLRRGIDGLSSMVQQQFQVTGKRSGFPARNTKQCRRS